MRILIGTLQTIENEAGRCFEAIARQTHRPIEHFIVRDLPNKQAHDTLYRTFMSRAAEFDLFVKIDADMVLCDERFLEQVAARFESDPAIDALIVSVHDWFTDRLIEGLHVYRSGVTWRADDERVFVDRADVPLDRIAYDAEQLAPAAWHCPDPSPFQAFHIGLHKGVKVLAAMHAHHPSTARFHAENIEQTHDHHLRRRDRRLALAAIAGEMALRGRFGTSHVDYHNAETRAEFERLDAMSDGELDHTLKSLRRRNLAALPPIVRAELLCDGAIRFAARRVIPSSMHAPLSKAIRGVAGIDRTSPAALTPRPDRITIVGAAHPPVTWLLPVRNAMPFLTEALGSIAAQTYPNHRVLAWDNGSTDGSLNELRRWIPSRIPGVVIHGNPLPLGVCLAHLVQLSPTELCARFDADDLNDPARLAEQVAHLLAHPDVALVGSNVLRIDEAGSPLGPTDLPIDDADIRWSLRFRNTINHPTVLFRRSAVLAAGNYRDMAPGQDYDLWVRLAARSPLANLPAPLVRYRIHSASVSTAKRLVSEPDHIRQTLSLVDYAAGAFPGVSLDQALELRRVLMEERADLVTLRHIRLLKEIAVQAARAADRPERYFQQTRLYRQQRRYLLLSLLKRNPLIRAAHIVLRAIHPARATETTPLPAPAIDSVENAPSSASSTESPPNRHAA